MLTRKWLKKVMTYGMCVMSANSRFKLEGSILIVCNVPILLSANAVTEKIKLTLTNFQSKKSNLEKDPQLTQPIW